MGCACRDSDVVKRGGKIGDDEKNEKVIGFFGGCNGKSGGKIPDLVTREWKR